MATAQEILTRNRSESAIKLQYPSGRIESTEHKMLMNFHKFTWGIGDNLTTSPIISPRKTTASIQLPIPIKVMERYDAIYTAPNNMAKAAEIITRAIAAAGPIARTRYTQNILDNALTGSGMLMNALGESVNPYTTIKFEGIPLRKHSFRWKFSPESKENTNELEKIIEVIRIRMHPESSPYVPGNIILSYPEIINFRMLGPKDPDHIWPSAPCVINSFNVDRTGGDYPSFFRETGTPVVYGIYMNVTEILPLLRENDKLVTTNQ